MPEARSSDTILRSSAMVHGDLRMTQRWRALSRNFAHGCAAAGPRRDSDAGRNSQLTSRTLSSFSVRNMYSDVHARSLGLCPTPATRTFFPSRRASSRTSPHSASFSGSNTESGRQVYVSPQFVNDARADRGDAVTGARSSQSCCSGSWLSLLEDGGWMRDGMAAGGRGARRCW